MASEPDPERLRALEHRLAKLTDKPKPQRHQMAQGFSQGELAWRMVIELSAGILVGVGLGYGFDRLFGTLPIFLTIFTLLGFIAGVRSMMRTAREMGEKAEARQRAAEAVADDKAAQAASDTPAAEAAVQKGADRGD